MDQKTIATYNQMAKEYDDETKDFWQRFPTKIFDKFAKKIKSGFILDIGSGPGRDAQLLRDRGINVICLDASAEMIKMTLNKNLPSVQADLLSLPFTDNSFTGIWAYTSLLHIPKKEIDNALSEITRVLKKNGILGLGLIEGNEEIYKQSSGVNKPRLFSYYQKEELEKILQKHGFKILYFETFKPGSKNYLHFLAQKMK